MNNEILKTQNLHLWLLVVALGGWTLVLGGFLLWDLNLARQHIEALAIKEARSNFNKDLAFRLWATRHGGIYVPVDERTQPNPGLAHLPERDITTPSGVELTLMNPAYMLRQMMDEYGDFYGVRGRITSLKPINPVNQPDAWERAALKRFEAGGEEVMEFQQRGGEEVLRLMRPMYTDQGCLKCHAHQGYREGDIRGGIGVVVNMRPYLESLGSTRQNRFIFFTVVWLLGLVVIVSLDRQVLRRLRSQEAYEQAEAKHKQALQRANADLTRLAEVSAHHLMEPTRRLLIYSRRLREQLNSHPDQEVRTSLDFVERNADYLRGLVRDIRLYLNAAKPQDEVVDQDPAEVVKWAREQLPTLVATSSAEIVVEPQTPPMRLDLPRARDIFVALLENAMLYREPEKPARIVISGERRGEVNLFRIEDNGHGLPATYRHRVFEIFERRAGGFAEGTGIGLALVRRIIESRGGEIYLEESRQGGLAVVFTLPVTP